MARTARVPGEVAPEAQDTPQTEQTEESVSVPKSVLDNLLAEVKSLKAKVEAQPKAGKRVNPTENLPDQSEVKFKSEDERPQLSKQGWVVPPKFGATKKPVT